MAEITVHGKGFDRFIESNQIADRVSQLAKRLAAPAGPPQAPPPIFVGVLNGAAIFHADLIRACDFPLQIAYIRTRSYAGMQSTGEVRIDWPDDLEVDGRRVVLVEDIVDSGRTLNALVDAFAQRGASEVRTVVLLDKPDARVQAFEPDEAGFTIPNDFVLGYGLDYDGLGRNLPDIYRLAQPS